MRTHKVEPIKRLIEMATGAGVPSREEALSRVRDVAPLRMKFRDDGYIPNNPKLPLLYYRKAIRLGRTYDPAATIEVVFKAHGCGDAWRNGIYDFVHYHSMIHEALGVARGSAVLRLGGNKGKSVKVSAGDVILVPAGVGHECLKASDEFLAAGRDLQRMPWQLSGARQGHCVHSPGRLAHTKSSIRKTRPRLGLRRYITFFKRSIAGRNGSPASSYSCQALERFNRPGTVRTV